MSDDPRHRLGHAGECFAAEHLERLGYAVVARNHRTRFGEIDIVAADPHTLVFAEVKTRRAGGGSPWDTLDERKRKQVRAMAGAYLAEQEDRPRRPRIRFDAIGIVLDRDHELVRLDHLEGAF